MTEAPEFARPTPAQELLLKACLHSGREAVAFWEAWREVTDIECIDAGSRRLLPLLYAALADAGVDHPAMGKYRGMWRMTWCRNQIIMRHGLAAAAALRRAGIPTMVLKGAALNLVYYRDFGLRPMLDFDLLVPTQQAHSAVALLGRLGWTDDVASHLPTLEALLRISHSRAFQNSHRAELDLHWHALPERTEPDADDQFWETGTSADPGAIRLPEPADLLLMVSAHGACWNPIHQIQWLADAAMIVRSGRVMWKRLQEQATRCRVVLPLRQALTYLHTVLGEDVPNVVLRGLAAVPVERADVEAYHATLAPVRGLASTWRFHRRQCVRVFGRGPRGYARYLRTMRPKVPLWGLPFWCAIYIARKLAISASDWARAAASQ